MNLYSIDLQTSTTKSCRWMSNEMTDSCPKHFRVVGGREGERHSSVFVDVLQKRWRPGHIGSCRLFSYVNISLLWGESDGGIPGTAYRSPSRILAHFPTSAKPSMLWTIIISLIGRKVRFQAYFVRNAKSEVPKYNFCLESAVRNWDLLRSNADTRRHA